MFWAYRQGACLLRMHPSCLLVMNRFLRLSLCESQEQSFAVSTSKYVCWSTIGKSCYPDFQSEDTGFTLSALHTTTVHVFTLAVTVHFLVYSSAFSSCFFHPFGVSDIPTKYCTNIYPDTVSFHYRDSFLMLRLLLSSDWYIQYRYLVMVTSSSKSFKSMEHILILSFSASQHFYTFRSIFYSFPSPFLRSQTPTHF